MRHAVIMAGGAGTRFWPASRAHRPKQLLDLWGEPMIRSTAKRLTPLVPFERQWIITGASLVDPIAEILPELPIRQLIPEPVGRNTAPCVGLAAMLLEQEVGPDAVFGVFPSDHFISGEAKWLACLEAAYRVAAEGPIVTLGIRPTRPETGFGYIQAEASDAESWQVNAFVEKPDRATALRYLSEGHYLWNVGIFFFKVSTILAEIERQLPDLHHALGQLRPAWNTPAWSTVFSDVFESLTSISIDYGVMEGAQSVRVIPADFQWSDVGHWGALDEVSPVDTDGNVNVGNTLALDTQNTVLVQTGQRDRLLVSLGNTDLVIVDTDDATLVCPRDRVQQVRDVVSALKDRDGGKWI